MNTMKIRRYLRYTKKKRNYDFRLERRLSGLREEKEVIKEKRVQKPVASLVCKAIMHLTKKVIKDK